MRDGACHPDAAGRNSVRVRLMVGSEIGVEERVTCCSGGASRPAVQFPALLHSMLTAPVHEAVAKGLDIGPVDPAVTVSPAPPSRRAHSQPRFLLNRLQSGARR